MIGNVVRVTEAIEHGPLRGGPVICVIKLTLQRVMQMIGQFIGDIAAQLDRFAGSRWG